jgi:broad specificity phosphatase PhoE
VKLYLMRHAESQGNAEFRLQGRREFPLTERGIRQAEALAERLAERDITAIYASPLQRTMQTAQVLSQRLSIPITQEERLAEYDFGDAISGLKWEEIRSQFPDIIRALGRDDAQYPRYPGEEGRAAFTARVSEAMSEIVARHTDQSVAVVTHAGPIVAYVVESLGTPYRRPVRFAISNASITTVEVGEAQAFAKRVVTAINDTCHWSRTPAHA